MHGTALGLVRARLHALLDLHDTTPTAVAHALGRSGTWLRRKLGSEPANPRPLTLEDVDLVLHHLDEPVDALFHPVLLPGDLELLAFCLEGRSTSELLRVFRFPERAVHRLEGQGLLEAQGEGAFIATASGARLLDR